MQFDFFDQWAQIREREDTYVLATVVAVRGSSSAKPGSRAIISRDGRNLWGWIGGGCAESFLIKTALEVIQCKQSRMVTVDLDDELLGVGMPCGGYMDVFLEPVFPARKLLILGAGPVAGPLAALAARAGYAVTVQCPDADPDHFPFATLVKRAVQSPVLDPGTRVVIAGSVSKLHDLVNELLTNGAVRVGLTREADPSGSLKGEATTRLHPQGVFDSPGSPQSRAILMLARFIADERGRNRHAMSISGIQNEELTILTGTPELLIIGRGRLAEELAGLGAVLQWKVRVNGPELEPENYPKEAELVSGDLDLNLDHINKLTCVVIASQHKGDHKAALNAIARKASYIGLIASRKRAGLVLEYLQKNQCKPWDLERFHGPAGLDVGAANPFEIALSVVCQILDHFQLG